MTLRLRRVVVGRHEFDYDYNWGRGFVCDCEYENDRDALCVGVGGCCGPLFLLFLWCFGGSRGLVVWRPRRPEALPNKQQTTKQRMLPPSTEGMLLGDECGCYLLSLRRCWPRFFFCCRSPLLGGILFCCVFGGMPNVLGFGRASPWKLCYLGRLMLSIFLWYDVFCSVFDMPLFV